MSLLGDFDARAFAGQLHVMGEPATYTRPAGQAPGAADFKVVMDKEATDLFEGVDGLLVKSRHTARIWVRESDMGFAPERGGRFAVANEDWTISAEPAMDDANNGIWQCVCYREAREEVGARRSRT